MAIQVNTTIKTADDFEAQPFCFLDIQLYTGMSRAILSYYKTADSYKSGASPINVPLPALAEVKLNKDEFFGPNLAMIFHQKAVELIEAQTGPGTCVIVENI